MDNRIIKDIRYYESKPLDYHGEFNGVFGNVYKNTSETKFIGQRIARKLNELRFISGEFDHIYLDLTSHLRENEFQEDKEFLDRRIKRFYYGISPDVFNALSSIEKDNKIKEYTFSVLNYIYRSNESKLNVINEVKRQIEEYGRQIIINYKSKETSSYLIEVSFQIRPFDNKSKMIIKYSDKRDNFKFTDSLDLFDYDDIYYLIDTISFRDGIIILNPKKSQIARYSCRGYRTPLTFEIKKEIQIKTATNNKYK